MPDKDLLINVRADFSQAERSGMSTAAKIELNFYRITVLIERINRLAKQFFGVEMPRWATDAINDMQAVVATVRTTQALVHAAQGSMAAGWAAALGPIAVAVGAGVVLGAAVVGVAQAHEQGLWQTERFREQRMRGYGGGYTKFQSR